MSGVSQSRYSIVERLTDSKLDLISDKTDIDSVIEQYIQKITIGRKDLENYKISAAQDIEREVKNRNIELTKLEAYLEYKQKKRDERLSSIDAKIVEIDKAMTALQEISKASAQEANK